MGEKPVPDRSCRGFSVLAYVILRLAVPGESALNSIVTERPPSLKITCAYSSALDGWPVGRW